MVDQQPWTDVISKAFVRHSEGRSNCVCLQVMSGLGQLGKSPQQSSSSCEKVDRGRTVCDERGLDAQTLEEFCLQGEKGRISVTQHLTSLNPKPFIHWNTGMQSLAVIQPAQACQGSR